MRLAILGLGLMGGSVARALRTRAPGAWTVSAWSSSGRGPAAAITAGAIDVAAPSAAEAIAGADVVLLAVPPLDCLTLIDELAGPLRASLRGGAVVTETVFSLPGVGQLVVSSVLRRDYPVIQGVILMVATAYVMINLAVDLLYFLVDPRVKY